MRNNVNILIFVPFEKARMFFRVVGEFLEQVSNACSVHKHGMRSKIGAIEKGTERHGGDFGIEIKCFAGLHYNVEAECDCTDGTGCLTWN